MTNQKSVQASTPKVSPMKITPYVSFKDAAAAIAFYVKAFGAKECYRLTEPSGRIGHAEITIGDAVMMMSDEYPDWGALSAQTLGACPIVLHLFVADVDAFVAKALAAGATSLRPVTDEFYGDRTAQLADPFGYKWMIATRQKHVSPGEMQRLWTAALAGGQ